VSWFTDMFGPFPTNLDEWQASPMVHPYTCPNRSEPGHVTTRDLGVLTVVEGTWLRCDSCGYEQTWTHFASPTDTQGAR
jgi:hypothetical protein